MKKDDERENEVEERNFGGWFTVGLVIGIVFLGLVIATIAYINFML